MSSKRLCAPCLALIAIALWAQIVGGAEAAMTARLAALPRNGLIAFQRTSYSPGGKACCTRIYTMKPDGSHLRQLAPSAGSEDDPAFRRSTMLGPVFSPRGTAITFSSRGGLFSTTPNGGSLRELVATTSILDTPSYSPDGSILIDTDFTDGFVFTMNSDGSDVAVIPGTATLIDPVFSPDGLHVLASRSGGGHGRLITMRPNGEAKRPIRGSGGDVEASYSPDGRHILFDHVVGHVGPTYRYGLFEMRANGAHVRRVGRVSSTFPMEPTYSPDGRFIVFAVRRSALSYDTIWVMRRNGRHARQVTHAGSNVDSSAPSWQPLPGGPGGQ